MTYTELMAFVASLFSMMNPIGGVGIFAGMTADKTLAEARAIAIKCAVAASITLLLVIWGGGGILALFGITVTEVRVAGGLIVLIIGLHMLFDKHEHASVKDESSEQASASIAVVPLAIPLVAGPGTMATVLVAAQHHAGMLAKLELSLAALAICILTGVLFSFAKPLAQRLGDNGMSVVSRVMGMILIAIAVGMLSAGLRHLFPVLAQHPGV